MSKGHNKKRNVGIVYEQLVFTVSRATVEKDQETADKALKIIKSYFAPGTELYKEYRLFNALVQTHVGSEALASRILEETKMASSNYDLIKLRREKSGLVNEINRVFGKDKFYMTPVKNYKLLATIHTLMEEWRSSSPDVMRRVQYESKLHEWLLTPKTSSVIEEMKTPNINDLTVKIMRGSFNKKFDSLNEKQRDLIRTVVFEEDKEKVVKTMREQKEAALLSLRSYSAQCDSKHVASKIPQAVSLLESLNESDTSDSNIAKFLTVAQLCDELMENKNV